MTPLLGKTIQIFLPDGNPRSVKIATGEYTEDGLIVFAGSIANRVFSQCGALFQHVLEKYPDKGLGVYQIDVA